MNQNKEEKNSELEQKSEKKPNENAGFNVSTHFKIFDPNSKEIFVKQRGDD